MHLHRLVIEAGSASFTLDLHPRMTVVAGAGALERDGLVGELLTTLGPGRPGVHAQLRTDRGSRLALQRPVDGPDRLVDVDRRLDLTERFRSRDGHVDLLGHCGLDRRAARRLLRMTESDLHTDSQEDEVVRRLGHLDQARLWSVADKVVEREQQLQRIMEEMGGSVDDAYLYEQVEFRHAAAEAAAVEHERVRSASFLVGASAGIALLPLTALVGLVAAVPLGLLAVGSTGISGWYWRRLEQAKHEEAVALQAAGADSYMAFAVHRVRAGASAEQRRRISVARDAFRAARSEWQLLAGDVPVEWALARRIPIRRAAEGVRRAAGVRSPMISHLPVAEGVAPVLASVVQQRLDDLSHAGPGGESLPLLLDDPFVHLPRTVKAQLLEVLVRAAGEQQVIYLTQDDDVASWARVEALTGDVGLVEPRRDRDRAEPHGRHAIA